VFDRYIGIDYSGAETTESRDPVLGGATSAQWFPSQWKWE